MPQVGAHGLDIPNHFPAIPNRFLIGFDTRNSFCGFVPVVSPNKVIYRRDVLFAEEYLPYRHGREMLGAKFDQWVRPEIGELSRSHLREAVRVDLTLDGWDDGSLAVAATNLSADPTTWMDLSGGRNGFRLSKLHQKER